MEQLYLYILLIAALSVIVVLALVLCRCRRRLDRCQEAIVRLINENLDMKEKLPAHERPNFMNRGDITPEEFTRIIDNMLKRLMFLSLFFLAAAYPSAAQEKQDTTYLFRFVPEKDMFYSPWNGNGEQLARLLKCIGENRSAIEAGQMFLLVTSYGTDSRAEQTASEAARIRRNRVKSELIVRGKLKEAHFVTDKSFTEPYRENGKEWRDIVVVTLPADVAKVAEIAGTEAAARVEAYNKEVSGEAERERIAAEEARAAERAEQERIAEERRKAEEARTAAQRAEAESKAAGEQAGGECIEPEAVAAKVRKDGGDYRLALRANLTGLEVTATITPWDQKTGDDNGTAEMQ